MSRLSPLVVAAAFLAAAAPAGAAVTEIGPNRYLCEAQAGERVRQDVSGFFNGYTLAARVRMLEARRHPDVYSAASLDFELSTGRAARLMVLASPEGENFMWFGIMPPVDANGIQIAAYRMGRTIEVSGTMARGAVFARSGNDRGQIYVGEAQLTGRAIVCSSGRFEIELIRHARRARRY
jgi:hypothetical protein